MRGLPLKVCQIQSQPLKALRSFLPWSSWIAAIGGLTLVSTLSTHAIAGVLIAPSVSWSALSFRAQESETTPTYFSYKPALTLGVSIKQVWDLALYGEYAPLAKVRADYRAKQGEQMAYGFASNWRIKENLLFGLVVGPAKVQLKPDPELELSAGEWTGVLYGLRFATINKINKHNFWEAGITYSYMVLNGKLNQETEKSRHAADSVALYLSCVFNHQQSSFIEDSILGSFLKSLTFL